MYIFDIHFKSIKAKLKNKQDTKGKNNFYSSDLKSKYFLDKK